ncbi:MFS transporter [Kaustia mangrovi]|uniref:MFS transporter n=1 Tax=Kaustia mangrovi TaxID=2593653 RepID=A0A7S8C7E5_9HYPH|nr:MFS transporter [Kaustia mangrovi]QPC44691.1 MFS transporter [Kaustia mangrovi]
MSRTVLSRAAGGAARIGDGRLMVPGLALATGAVVTTEFVVVGLLPVLADDLDITLDRAGWLVSGFALSAAVAGPAVTLAAARWRPRPVLVLSLVAFGLANLAAALLPVYGVLMGARMIQGAILTHFVSLASALAASRAGPRNAGRAIGQVNMGAVMAIVIAVPAGAAFADLFGWRAVLAGLGAATLASAGLVRATTPPSTSPDQPPPWRQARILLGLPFLLHLALSACLFTAMFASYSYIAAFLKEVAGLSGPEAALALLGFGLAGIAGNWLASRLVDRDATALTTLVALLLVAAVSALPLAVGDMASVLALLGLWGAAHTAAFVSCQVRVMFAGAEAPAFAASLNIAVCNLGIAAGAALGGWIIQSFGLEAIALGSAATGLAAVAIGLVLHTLQRGSDAG